MVSTCDFTGNVTGTYIITFSSSGYTETIIEYSNTLIYWNEILEQRARKAVIATMIILDRMRCRLYVKAPTYADVRGTAKTVKSTTPIKRNRQRRRK